MLKKLSTFLRTHTRKMNKAAGETQDELFLACQEVQENISEAVKFLKERLLSFKAFQQMPWYLVLGAKGVGKTQLIAKSELVFLEEERFVQLTPPGLETKSGVNWWLSSGAVLVDVPGAYLEAETHLTPHRAAWFELLRQIRRYRFRRPLNGIIVTVSVTSLQRGEETHLLSRLQEVIHRLKQRLPIYLVITQMDQVKGFQDYFDDLGKNEREQYAGFTFPLRDKTKTPWVDIFSESFDHLMSNLHRRVLWRIHQEQDSSKRQVILNFPQQLNVLKENLRHFIHALNSLKAHASLRGVYFTSSLSDSTPAIDHIGETVEKQFALVTPKVSSFSLGWQRAFFIKSLFEQKIFPEARLANDVLRTTASRQDNFLRWGALGVAGLMLLSITVISSQHYKQQTLHLDKANTALSDYKLLALAYMPSTPQIDKLLPALDALLLAQQSTAKAQLPWLLRFQLHRQAPLAEITDQLYSRDLQTKLIPAVRYQIANQLQQEDVTDSAKLYDLLKVYLMLGDPLHADKVFLQQWFLHEWNNPIMQNQDFRKHWKAAIEGPIPALSSDVTLVQKIRATLNALPYNLLSHAVLRNNVSSQVSLEIQDRSHTFLFPSFPISELFTAHSLAQVNTHINDALYVAINGNWVLGNKAAESLSANALKTLQNTLIDEYTENYVNTWQQFLTQTHINHFDSLASLERSLQILTQDHSPLEKILGVVYQNTQLNVSPNNALMLSLSNKLNVSFHALNNVSLMALRLRLQNLQTQIQDITHNQNPDAKALEVAQQMALQKGQDAVLALMQQAKPLPNPLKQWILSLANQSRDLILSRASAYTWQQWQLQILPLCRSTIENHYPFVKSSSQEISLYDFTRFFAKGGIFDQFFNIYLSPFVATNLARWQWKNVDGGAFNGESQRLDQFERANIIKEMYFNHKNKLEAFFTLNDHRYIWPLDTQHISVNLYDTDGEGKILSTSGDWSIFKLIDQGNLKPQADGKTYHLLFDKANVVLKTELINPFIPGVVNKFRCP